MTATQAEWDALADAAGAPPFLRPGWIEAWWRAFGRGALELVELRRDGELAGIVPVSRRLGALSAPANYHSPEFGLLARDDDAARSLAAELLGRGARSVLLRFLPERDVERMRSAASAAGWTAVERGAQTSPAVELGGDWERYEAGLSKNLRSDVRRRRRRLEEEGAVEVEIVREPDRVVAALEEGYALEGSGWKDAQGTAIRSRPETRRFYDEVARWAAEAGTLRLCFLRLDGRPIAFHYDLEANGVLYHLKGGYDTDFDRFSPGKVLHWAMLERAFAEGLASYEFLGGADRYKTQFSNRTRRFAMLQAFAPTAAGRAERLAVVHGRPAARALLRLAQQARRRLAERHGEG